MGRRRSAACQVRGSATALLLCAAIFSSGCALLIPPSWRGRAPLPLAGPLEEGALDGSGVDEAELAAMSDEDLARRVEADRRRLEEIASRPGEGPLADETSEAELRELADRLPRLQRELARRRGELDDDHVIR